MPSDLDPEARAALRDDQDDEYLLAHRLQNAATRSEKDTGETSALKWANEDKWAEFGRDVAAGHRKMPVPENGLAPFCHCGLFVANCRDLRLLTEYGLH